MKAGELGLCLRSFKIVKHAAQLYSPFSVASTPRKKPSQEGFIYAVIF
jgi:hypothetical protein